MANSQISVTSVTKKKALNVDDKKAILNRNFSDTSYISLPMHFEKVNKKGETVKTHKTVLLSFDTVIGDQTQDELYKFSVNLAYGDKSYTAYSLTLDYSGNLSTLTNVKTIVAQPYMIDGFDRSAPMVVLAQHFLEKMANTNDPLVGLFFSFLDLLEYHLIDGKGLPSIAKKKVNEKSILENIALYGSLCPNGHPLKLYSEYATKTLEASTVDTTIKA